MWKQDGWMMVDSDLGGPDHAREFPYFVLYNKFRGVLRVMVFNTDIQTDFNCYLGELKFNNPNDGTSPIFTFSAYPKCFLNDYNGSIVEKNINASVTRGNWLCCDFVAAGYDPDLASKRLLLEFTLHAIRLEVTRTSSEGILEIQQILEGTSPTGVAMMGSALGDWINSKLSGYATYPDENRAAEAVRGAQSRTGQPWLASVVSAAAGTTGLGAIASGLVGALTSYLGGGSSQRTPMNFTGKVSLVSKGTVACDKYLCSFTIPLGKHTNTFLAGENVATVPWGVFNLEAQPMVFDQITPDPRGGFNHVLMLDNDPRVLVNPAIGFQSVKTTVAFTFEGERPGTSTPEQGADTDGYFPYPSKYFNFHSDSGRLPSGMAVQINAQVPGAPLLIDKPIKILKVYPVTAARKLDVAIKSRRIENSGPGNRECGTAKYQFSAVVSDARPGGQYRYRWTVGGNSPRARSRVAIVGDPNGPEITCTLELDGEYAIELEVTDSFSFKAAAKTTVSTIGRERGRLMSE
jgi:hypothetical protein